MDSPLVKAIKKAYKTGEEDESLEPMIAVRAAGRPLGRIREGDYVIFYDVRGEREVELTESLVKKNFSHFPLKKNLKLNFVTMIEYSPSFEVKVAFPSEKKIENTLTEVLSKAGLRQLKIAESEKAIHIGFFMNGRSEEIFPGEERIIVPSPHGLSSYALKPEMSAAQVAEEISKSLKDPSYQLIIANLANVDVVGHSEDKAAVVRAVEEVDLRLGQIIKDCRNQHLALVVTSDHGTAEEWLYADGSINTGHTRNPAPFILCDFSLQKPNLWQLKPHGELADVAPTILELLALPKPSVMSGRSLLLNFDKGKEPRRKVLLLILDGWGMRQEKYGNLIMEAKTPNFRRLWSSFPRSLLKASAEAVGMPSRTVGNSEAGHLHLGAGRRVILDRLRIDKAIEDGSFFHNKAFLWAMEGAKKEQAALHLLGIVSHYSSHGTVKHLFALLQMAKKVGVDKVFVHCLIGRRGERRESGAAYVAKVEKKCKSLSCGQVVSVIGRFWALDREENWDRVEKAYRALVYGDGVKVSLIS